MTDVISDDGIDIINLGTINPDGTRSGNALIRNSLRGSNDKDYINLYSGRVGKGGSRFFAGNVHGDNGGDEILLDGAFVLGTVFGGTGDDILMMKSGRVVISVWGQNGTDKITIGDPMAPDAAGPTIGGAVDGGTEDDLIAVISGKMASVTGGDAVDRIWLYGGEVTGAVDGAAGVDTIILGGAVGENELVPSGSPLRDNPTKGSKVQSIRGGADNDTIILHSGNVTSTGNAVTGGDGDDLLELDGSTVAGAIQGDGGSDTINLKAGSGGAVDGGAGIDFITQTGGSVVSIAGGTENDEIRLTGGTVTSVGDAVTGGDGDDLLELDGLVMSGRILGGADNDTFDIESGSTAALDGGTGDDEFYLNGGAVTGSVIGGDGKDTINLGYTKAGALTAGTAIGGNVLGGSGDDTITWWSGAFAGSINGEFGSDIVRVGAASGYDGSRLLNGGDDTGTADGFTDTLTISGKTVALAGGELVNWEKIELAGGGLTLTNGALDVGDLGGSTTGLFLTGGAHLHSTAALDLNGNLDIGADSSLAQLSGNSHAVRGRLANAGTIDLQDGGAGDVLSVGGNYVGGGQIRVDIDGDLADRMAIAGNVSGSPTHIVTRAIGDITTGIPIEVVRVSGTTAAGDFTAADFDLGAYSYSLQLAGNVWQFTPTEITDGGTLYPTVGGLLSLFARQTVATHFQRSGAWSRARVTGEVIDATGSTMTLTGDNAESDGNLWLRGIGQWAEGEGRLAGGAGEISNRISYDRDVGGIQGGMDFVVLETASHLVTAGVFGQTGQISGEARNESHNSSAGSAESEAWGVGASIGLDTSDFYSEIVGGWNFYDVSTVTNPGTGGDTEGDGYFLSVEAGQILALSSFVSVIPQAQLAWIGTDIDSFMDGSGVEIAYGGQDISVGRLGIALDAFSGTIGGHPLRLTGIVNYWRQFGDTAQAIVGGAPLSLEQAGGSIEAGAGFHWATDNAPLHLHGELTYRETLNGLGEQAWNGTIGARLSF